MIFVSRRNDRSRAVGLILVGLVALTGAAASDPFLWLEEVEGERALEWVRAQNERSLPQLTGDRRYERYYASALEIFEDRSRIPMGAMLDGSVYNFWQDDRHVRGIWRRARLESWLGTTPQWQVLLDLDELARAEKRNWVYKGATCLEPTPRRCMIALSDGGKDASVLREFDVDARSFVPDGFALPEAKSTVAWVDENTLLVATDFGPGTLTVSGYPYVVKRWQRGQPLAAATEIHRGQKEDVMVGPARLRGPGGDRLLLVAEGDSFYTGTYRVVRPTGGLDLITLPPQATVHGLYRDELVFSIDEDWTVGSRSFASGALLSMPASEMTRAEPAVRTVHVPGPRDAIRQVAVTSAGLLVVGMSNVRSHASRFTFDNAAWRREPVPMPAHGTITLDASDPASGTALLGYQDFLQPTTVYAIDVAANRARLAKSLPAKFDASRSVVEQLEATSRDGTRVPYFLVRPKQFTANGSAPTVLAGYGGFQVSLLPSYAGTIGKLWLEQGGVFVVANIRGGGEFGPAWHQAGLKTRRQVVYDDFIAVAEDLVRRKITSPAHLGIRGGSNGGLLMGVMLTQRPELFGAAVIRSPLLDMLRYHQLLAGALWVAEYGSPDVPEERAWLEQLSPYHHLARRTAFPEPFLLTSTRDDRVHPGHARKYAAKLDSLGMPYLYYENIEGGHSAAADLRQRAQREALEFVYLAQRLMPESAPAANRQDSTPAAEATDNARVTVLKAARLFDGVSGELRTDAVIVVAGSRIARVGGAEPVPAGARIVELGDTTLLPGFIDAHAHLGFEFDADYHRHQFNLLMRFPAEQAHYAGVYARRTLEAGFTTVRNVGSRYFLDVGLRNAIDAGVVPGPRILTAAHSISATGGSCDQPPFPPDRIAPKQPLEGVCNGPEQCREAVRNQMKWGADVIKVCVSGGVLSYDPVDVPQLTADETRAIVDEAHAWGRKVAAHAHGDTAARRAIEAGVDSIEHGSFLSEATLKLMQRRGVYLVPTRMALYWVEKRADTYPPAIAAKARTAAAAHADMFRMALRLGVPIALGTDATVMPGGHGRNAMEFGLMTDVGMSPSAALLAGTRDAARLLGVDKDSGTLEAGKTADIVVVRGDPLADIRTTERPLLVMRGGTLVVDRR